MQPSLISMVDAKIKQILIFLLMQVLFLSLV
jgi:hypothetical protein